MSVRPIDGQRSFYHTDYLAGNLFGPANRYRLFREKIWPKLLELAPKLEALYCAENGRPPIDPVLLALTVVSGLIDAVSYLGLSHVFTANMTGNVVVLGFDAADPDRLVRFFGDLPTLWPRHLNVAESVMSQSKSLIEDWLYINGSEDGWWYCPYGCQGGGAVGLSQETILRNTMGLKNTVSMLLEARSSGGSTTGSTSPSGTDRPGESTSSVSSSPLTVTVFGPVKRA